jgi:hypothetical protein
MHRWYVYILGTNFVFHDGTFNIHLLVTYIIVMYSPGVIERGLRCPCSR